VALLAAEDVVVLEVDVVNPEALLDVAVVLEEGGVIELELLAVVEEKVVLELLLEERGVIELELELVAVEGDAVLEVESVDVGAMLVEDILVEERGIEELELLAVEEDAVFEVESVDVDEGSSAEDVLDDAVV
jgi:hypothetical protein